MTFAKKFWIGFAAVGAIAGGVLFYKGQQKPAAKPLELTIYFSGDTRGRLVPCGCFTGQFGGLSRLQTYLEQDAVDSDIKVDIGDAIGGAEDFHRIQYSYLLQAYARMKFDALNLGHREAQLSAAHLRQIKQSAPVTLLSANLLDASTGKPIFEPCKILQRGTRNIAVVGVMDSIKTAESLGAGLRIEPMEAALERLLPDLRRRVDAMILLAFTDEAGLARLAQQFYEPNLILGGKVSQPSQKLLRENRSVILYIANESRAIGMLKARFMPQFNAESFDMVMLHDRIPEHPEILELARQYRQTVRGARLDVDDLNRLESDSVPGVKNRALYVGTERCLSCHPSAAAAWHKSEHSHAFTDLVNKQADADPSCVPCHVVGFGSASGYRRGAKDQNLIHVGCESCHGPGSLHLASRKEGAKVTFTYRPLAAGDCKLCHHGEFSRPFEWDPLWNKIKHGKEIRPTGKLQ